MRLPHWTTARILDRYRCSCPIHEQLFAGRVLLPQHDILFPPPTLVQLAKPAVLVAVRVCLPVLLPKQLLRNVWMLLPLPVKIGEVRYGQHRSAAAWRPSEQRGLKPIIVPLRSKRPRDLGSFGSLQILVCGAEANRTASGDRSQPQAHFKLQSKNFFDLAHGQSPGWQADPPFRRGGCLPLCCPAPSACGNHSVEAERDSGVGLKVLAFIAESVFAFI